MAIASTVSNFLRAQDAEYDVLTHPHTATSGESAQAAHVPGSRLAKSVILEDEQGFLMVVLPSNRKVNMRELHRQLNRNLALAPEHEFGGLFADCETGALPPIGLAYGVETVVDDEIAEQTDIFFEAGDHEQLIHVSAETFQTLLGEGVQRGRFSQ
ncbi:MAG TPA: YbaK/EbsC family protein [Gammaproteobacteria bacterium]|nr:YbaK/EbsC family protein [Gammaproteobacteria bacterium]